LGCGKVYIKSDQTAVYFKITKFKDLTEKVIPFFKKYSICGVKALDFADFCEVAELMKSKLHLTDKGLNQIIKIKSGMNKGRE
jgi:hypothetical protein